MLEDGLVGGRDGVYWVGLGWVWCGSEDVAV